MPYDDDQAADLDELYQQMILDHSRSPRNFGTMNDATGSSDGHNPLCGDRVTVFAKVRGDRVEDVRFTGKGCAICVASASLMTEAIKGRTPAAAQALFDQFHQMLTGPNGDTPSARVSGQDGCFRGREEISHPRQVRHAALAHPEGCAESTGPDRFDGVI